MHNLTQKCLNGERNQPESKNIDSLALVYVTSSYSSFVLTYIEWWFQWLWWTTSCKCFWTGKCSICALSLYTVETGDHNHVIPFVLTMHAWDKIHIQTMKLTFRWLWAAQPVEWVESACQTLIVHVNLTVQWFRKDYTIIYVTIPLQISSECSTVSWACRIPPHSWGAGSGISTVSASW